MQQRRNDAKIDASLFNNIVTKNKEVRTCTRLVFIHQLMHFDVG